MPGKIALTRFGQARHRLDQDLLSTHGWSIAGPAIRLICEPKWQADAVSFADAVRRAGEETLYGLWLDPAPRQPPRIDITGFLVTSREGGNHHSSFPLGAMPETEARHLTQTHVARGHELAAELQYIEIENGQPVFTFIPLARI